MSRTFHDLGVDAGIAAGLADRGITTAFPIQADTIPAALQGRDVCGRAPTGSGKTLAFGIPLAMRVSRARVARPRALVLAPTRELAAQIERELAPMLKANKRSVASFYGGVGFTPQLKVLRRGVDVAVACPGRLADLVNRGVMILDEVEFVVIDEADRMADMGFLPEVKKILDRVRPDRQTLLFSATLDGDVDVLIKRYQKDPFYAEVATPEGETSRTTHHFVKVAREQRVRMTADLVKEHGSTVVFCRTKHGADRVAQQLVRSGVDAVAIHGDRSQGQRDRALAAFSSGKAQVLVATDVAARGIHVDDVACVVHFDPAGDPKDYVHRSGRTGRAGAEGVVVSYVTDADNGASKKIQRALGLEQPGSSLVAPPVVARVNTAAAGTATAEVRRPAADPDRPGVSRRQRARTRSNGTGAGSASHQPSRPGAPARRAGASAGQRQGQGQGQGQGAARRRAGGAPKRRG